MTVPTVMRRAWRVATSLRMLALFLIGPAAGVLLNGVIFGMPTNLRWAAVAMFLLCLSLFGLMARGEWRRLAHDRLADDPGPDLR